ncbi:glycosyltransferase [Streptomyces sp. NPDC012637]|uniref:glycosyltransferase n=1 Tax=Streptomyces sp. NPDC012637 TaxID=3364842 RepID=UPI0036E657D1
MKFSAVLDHAWAEDPGSPTALGRDLRLVRAAAPELLALDVPASSYAKLAASYRPDRQDRSARQDRSDRSPRSGEITAVVLTHNEEQVIGACLRALTDDCDRVLLVDSGSDDSTLRTAKAAVAHVEHVTRAWTDDFAAQRNAAFERVRPGGWLAHVDADETLSAESRGRLRAVLSVLDHALPGADLVVSPRILDTSRECHTNTRRVLRSHTALRFRGRVHERPYDAHGAEPPCVEVDVTFHHTGYEPEVIARKGKRERYARLIERCLAEEPSNPKWHFYAVRDGMVGRKPGPDEARSLYGRLEEARALYGARPSSDYEKERLADSLVLQCELALGFGGGREIGELAPLLRDRGRLLEASYYQAFAEFGALLNRSSHLLDQLAEDTRHELPGGRLLAGRSYDLQALLALTCGRYDDVPRLLEEARSRQAGALTTGTVESLAALLPGQREQ